MPTLKKGDVVQLKSGGPKMTCVKVPKTKNGQARCQWFVNDKLLKSGSFPCESLKLDELTKHQKNEDKCVAGLLAKQRISEIVKGK